MRICSSGNISCSSVCLGVDQETVVVRCRTMCEDMQPKFTGTLQLPGRVELALEGSVLRFCAY